MVACGAPKPATDVDDNSGQDKPEVTDNESNVTEAVENELQDEVVGTVHLSDTGCPYYIEANINKAIRLLYPINLEEKFKVEGLKIKFRYGRSKAPSPENCLDYTVVSVWDITPYR